MSDALPVTEPIQQHQKKEQLNVLELLSYDQHISALIVKHHLRTG